MLAGVREPFSSPVRVAARAPADGGHRARSSSRASTSQPFTVLSKRFLPRPRRKRQGRWLGRSRMPTLRGLRRRGFTPASIRNFCERIGMTRTLRPSRWQPKTEHART
ncbi:MAG: glutamate--tRNA ligase family protein [Planctomycetota bacterium]